jgi:murein DD-endopeptidase MepM/ murein hydrolase activator NlpD
MPSTTRHTLPSRAATRRAAWLIGLALALAALAAPATAFAQTASLATMLPSARRGADADVEVLRERRLLVPVQGVAPGRLRDSYRHARSGGRVHDAIDIHAPRGTPVVAVTDGEVLKLHRGARGGTALYLLDDDGRTRYYYAHLDGYAEGIREGARVKRGDVIGYVGDTGNAAPGDYHLHFAIAILSTRSRWWEGRNLNPFDVLRWQDYESAAGSDL